jgi:hypothetical protein
MMQSLDQMTNLEIKHYLSEQRNDEAAFRAGFQILMNRRDPSMRQPYPLDLVDPEGEVETLLKEKLKPKD